MANSFALLGAIEFIEAAASDSPEQNGKRFSVVAYNGGPLKVSRWDTPVVIDLTGMKFADRIVANLDHDASQRVGHVTDRTIAGSKVKLEGLLSAATPYRDEVIASSKEGFPWQASVEVAPTVDPEFIEAGKTATVNGRTVRGPVQIVRKSELYGFAFVSRGADAATKVTIAAELSSASSHVEGVFKMTDQQKAWIEAQGFDPEGLSGKQRESLLAAFAATELVDAATAPSKIQPIAAGNDGASLMGDDDWSASTILFAHAALAEEIDAICASADDVPADKAKAIFAKAKERAASIRKQATAGKWSEAQYAVEAVKATADLKIDLMRAARPQGPAIVASRKDSSPLVIEAALAQTVGIHDIEKHYDDKTLQAAHTQFRGRLGLKQLLIMAAAENGMPCVPGFAVHAGNVRDVLRFAVSDVHASFSTLSLPGILSNVANKEILEGYMEEDQSWREVSLIRNVNDFKSVTSYRLLDNMEYDELGADGKIKHGTLGEESYTRQAKTYAKMFAITRQDIINDDLGAFDALRARIGMGAAKKFNKVFWTKFLDNSSFYTSARTNYISGSTTNLGTDGLSAGVQAFRQMKSPAADGEKKLGEAVGGRPEILVVPPELEGIADILYRNANLGAVSVATANIHANKYRPVVVPWLSDSAFTGYSATAWYLFRAPRIMAPMVVSFLNGVQTPTVESAEADFDQLGIQFRGYHDFGADQAEYLAGIKSKGAE